MKRLLLSFLIVFVFCAIVVGGSELLQMWAAFIIKKKLPFYAFLSPFIIPLLYFVYKKVLKDF